MPYRSEIFRLPKHLDRRIKLTDAERDDILFRYLHGETMRGIARLYKDKCSRSLVVLICKPERALAVKERGKAHWRDYADRDRHAKAIRDTRRYKHRLFLLGKLEPGT